MVTIRDYDTIVHKRKLVPELMQGGSPTNRPPRWLALYGYLQQKNRLQLSPWQKGANLPLKWQKGKKLPILESKADLPLLFLPLKITNKT
jgi:hypothetical protein